MFDNDGVQRVREEMARDDRRCKWLVQKRNTERCVRLARESRPLRRAGCGGYTNPPLQKSAPMAAARLVALERNCALR